MIVMQVKTPASACAGCSVSSFRNGTPASEEKITEILKLNKTIYHHPF